MTNEPKPKLWTKDFIFVSTINFFLTLFFYLLMVTIVVYADHEFQASTSDAGLVAGIFVIGVLAGRLLAGRYVAQIGTRKLLFIGLLLMTITSLLYFVVSSLSLLIINRLLHGFTFGIAATATGTIVAQITPDSRRGEGVGFYSLSVSMAVAIGPFLGMLLTKNGDFRMIFGLGILLVLCSLCMAVFLTAPHQTLTKQQQQAEKGFALSKFFEIKSIPISIVMMIAGFAYSSIMSYFTFYAIEIDLVEIASFFFIIYAIVILLTRPFTGRLFDSKGPNLIIYPSLLLFGVGMILLSQAHHGIILLLSAAVIGLGFGNFQSSAQALAVKVAPIHKAGLATSTFFIFLDIGYGIGPYLLGFLIPYTGYRGLFFTMGFIAFLCMIVYYFLQGKDTSISKPKATAHL